MGLDEGKAKERKGRKKEGERERKGIEKEGKGKDVEQLMKKRNLKRK